MDIHYLPNISDSQLLAPVPSHALHPAFPYVVLTIGLVAILYWCIQDYRFFLSLGRGGPQYNIRGWFEVHILVRPFTLSARNTTWTEDYPENGAHKEILALPDRKGARPIIRGIAPQRQFSQYPEPQTRMRILELFSLFVSANPNLLTQRISHAERHNQALFVHPSLRTKVEHLPETVQISQGELGHVHGEASVHLYFSPADAKVIIEKGWGERHRCAKTQPWWFGGARKTVGIGHTFLIVYAPRSEEELEILKTLIRASATYMTGEHQIVKP